MGGLAITIGTAAAPSLPFVDTFSVSADPMADGSVYYQGVADGLDWDDFKVSGGLAYQRTRVLPNAFTDGIAIAKRIAGISTTKHYSQITCHRAQNYNSPDSHEIEALLLFDITAHVARGYEMDILGSGSMVPVRWNGSVSDYTPGTGTGGWATILSGDVNWGLDQGDVLKAYAEIVSGNPRFTLVKNGVTMLVCEDQTVNKFVTGYPGFGSFIRDGIAVADMDKYSISRFECGNW